MAVWLAYRKRGAGRKHQVTWGMYALGTANSDLAMEKTMEQRKDLTAREQLLLAALHAPDDAPFERLRQQLEGALAALPAYVVGAINLPQYTTVSEAAIAYDGTIALVGIARDGMARLRLWHPQRGFELMLVPTAYADGIAHLHFPEGSSQPAYVATSRSADGISRLAVWGNLRFELGEPVDSFLAIPCDDLIREVDVSYLIRAADRMNDQSAAFSSDVTRFVMTRRGSMFWVSFRANTQDETAVPESASYQAMLLGFASGELVVMETSKGLHPQRRVRCGEWTSEWFDGVWYRGVGKNGSVEIFARQVVDKKMRLWLVTCQGKRQLAPSIDPSNMFATNGRLFEVVSGSGRSHLRDLTGTFDVELPTEIAVCQVVCDGARVHVYGLFEHYGARRDEPHYTQFDLATGEVLRNQGVEETSLREVGGRVLLIGKRTFEDVSADVPWVYPHYGHPDRLTLVDGGLAGWHFVDNTLYALRYELSSLA